ncbi:multicopper oxidase domain-containing protein [Oligoflexus tunisiensis]|uniref:multicopper oxidase domain-containing protein n=1 Tax=Oligoflexus tunisiensis TaxID=708132 RepID=UPI000AA49AF2|nr:multicopper oxidase domain-containing protein [Oligoflexus tunisiensis]
MKRLFLLTIFTLLAMPLTLTGAEKARTVRYELVATQGTVNLSGKKSVDFALLVNGSLPAPTLEFTEGDVAEIILKNQIPGQEVSIHWHGLLLPPLMDGVPYVNTPPIPSGGSFTYRFPLRQSGTYWYHTHTNVQEQKGIYGAFIVHPKKPRITADKDAIVVLSDWSDEDATQILANLRKDGDYYLYKKGTVRSWIGAMRENALGIYLENEWTRMGGMDYSDVGYDAFLINGKRNAQLAVAHPGEKIRIRIINAAASTYFHVALGDRAMQVVAVDGVDMKPTWTREILIGMAETYDVLFEVPAHKNYELKATAQDGTGSASAWIGMGDQVPAPVKPMPPMYEAMDHGGHGGEHAGHADHSEHGGDHAGHSSQMAVQGDEHAAHNGHDAKHDKHPPKSAATGSDSSHTGHEDHSMHATQDKPDHSQHAGHGAADKEILQTLTVDNIQALEPTRFASNLPVHDVKLVLDGDMERYVWHINGKAIFEDRTIEIKEGQVIRFTMVNETMMHHPMHLHGHFFRVLNPFGDRSPWKHTVDVSPHTTRTIEFLANEPGEWMLHCHNLYHMKTGMARVVKYSSFTPSPEVARHQKHDPHNHDHTYFYGMLETSTNHGQAKFRLTQTWNELEARVETGEDYQSEVEGDLLYRRWQDRYLNFILGGSHFHDKTRAVAGVGYLLPMLIESNLLVDHTGRLRLDLDKRFQWTSTLFSDADVSFRQSERTEWEVSLMYANSWSWAAGLKVTEDNTGVGVQFQF